MAVSSSSALLAFRGDHPKLKRWVIGLVLLLSPLIGDSTLFARHDFVETSWALVSPIHEAWDAMATKEIPTYEAGEWGPVEANALVTAQGHRWRTL